MNWIRTAWFRWFDRELDRIVKLPSRDSIETGEWNRLVGETGERLAGKQIHRRGGKVLFRNFRAPKGGEVDIVYRDEETLVFAEVKTRTSDQFGRPGDAVDREKERLIIRGANAWLRELNLPSVLFRFDVIEVFLLPGKQVEVKINKDAFTTPQRGLGE
ncbi:MAG: YraN family protein [Verrucomicrobiales bacterium]|nr:YraN family protein [Verrucomicrobiales bacterium]